MTVRSLGSGVAPQGLVKLSLGAAEAFQLSLVDAVRVLLDVLHEELARVGVLADTTTAGDVEEARDELVRVWLGVKIRMLGECVK